MKQKDYNQPEGQPYLGFGKDSGTPDVYAEAGINRYTGKSIKESCKQGMYCLVDNNNYVDNYNLIKEMDRQQAIRRYTWFNLPDSITGELIERIMYFRGQGMLFYMSDIDEFKFLPFALAGDIDEVGKFLTVTPLPFNGTAGAEDKDKEVKAWITGLTKKPIYEFQLPEELTTDMILDGCVILRDRSQAISQTVVSRNTLNDVICRMEAEALPLARTSIIAHSGVKGVEVPDTDCFDNVLQASKTMAKAAMAGYPYIPVIGTIKFQDLSESGSTNTQENLMYMQALDNYRLQSYGIESGGVFEKKSHTLESEQQMNSANNGLIYNDGLEERQHFCAIVNSIWNLGIWCEPSENILGDINFNGQQIDEIDQSGTSENDIPIQTGGEDNE